MTMETRPIYPRPIRIIRRYPIRGLMLVEIHPRIPSRIFNSDHDIDKAVIDIPPMTIPALLLPGWQYDTRIRLVGNDLDNAGLSNLYEETVVYDRGITISDKDDSFRIMLGLQSIASNYGTIIEFSMDGYDYRKLTLIGPIYEISSGQSDSPIDLDERKIMLLKFMMIEFPFLMLKCYSGDETLRPGRGWEKIGELWKITQIVDAKRLYEQLKSVEWDLFAGLWEFTDFAIPEYGVISDLEIKQKLKENQLLMYLWSRPNQKRWVLAVNPELEEDQRRNRQRALCDKYRIKCPS